MTSEERQLLLKDFFSRLPYGIKYQVQYGDKSVRSPEKVIIDGEYTLIDGWQIYEIKMYLRPMESMTKDELKEFVSFTSQSMRRFICEATNTDHWFNNYEEEDWLNARHFDYRGLIEKGLALEATKDMYSN